MSRNAPLWGERWRFRGNLSPQNRRDFEHARFLRLFKFESNKNLLWCTPEGSLSQTWRTLLLTRPQKSRQKKGESSKGSKKTWSPSEEEYLISRWAEADCLFNTCSSKSTIFRSRRFFWAATKNNFANS